MHTYNDFVLDVYTRTSWRDTVDILSYYENVKGVQTTVDFSRLTEGYVWPINTSRLAEDYPYASTYTETALNRVVTSAREFERWLRYMENSTHVSKEVLGMKDVSSFISFYHTVFTLRHHPVSGLWHVESLYFHREFEDIVLAHQYYEMLMRHNFYEWYEKEES